MVFDSKKTICLNMIVKNESHIIEETLKNICQYVPLDYWVISDTGSSDNTKEIIENFFKMKNIPGELIDNKWKDFAYNRTKALECAFNKTDYLFIFDADDRIHGNFIIKKLDYDVYNIQFGNVTRYMRPILITNRKRWKYVGVLHEFITAIDKIDSVENVNGDYFIESGKTGSRSMNPNKYKDDAELLRNAYYEANDGLNDRYAFYCGQSYFDCGNLDESLFWYKKVVLELSNWNQEKYCACIRIGDIYKFKGNNNEAINFWKRGIIFDDERKECVNKLMELYINDDKFSLVNKLYEETEKKFVKNVSEKLFIDINNDWRPDFYNSIAGSYINEWLSGYYSCRNILINYNNIPDNYIIATLNNFNKCYIMNIGIDKNIVELLNNLVMCFKKYIITNGELMKRLWENTCKLFLQYLPDIYYDVKDIIEKKNYIDNDNDNVCKDIGYKNSNKILIYTGFMNFLWNDSTLKEKSIGGSEKAVIYLSRCLPKNYEIYIAGDQLEEEIDNIKYVYHNNLQKLLNDNSFHTVIVSRYVSFFEQFNNIKCSQLVVSAHDSTGFINFTKNNSVDNILRKNNKNIDYIICLTEWHKNNIIERHNFLKDKINIINNGINIHDFNKENITLDIKVKNRFIWSSCAYRGLDVMLNLWSKILEVMPDATLEICSYDTFPKNQYEEKMLEIINAYSSITHHGKLNTDQLYKLANTCEYWLYTNTFPETSCITGMEMLMCGVICLYYPLAGLNDTIGEYGIKIKQGREIETLINLSKERKIELTDNGKEYALTCSWENRAKEWSDLLGLNKQKFNTINNKIGIFNSFPFHYEMFGFILNYAKNNNIEVDIFTNQNNTLGWIDFYREKFNNFNIIDFNNFNGNSNKYSTFFVTTDDDPLFKSEWITDNVICLNHYYKIRNHNFKHYLNVANFKDSSLEYSYPCYPLINYEDKIQNTTVCIIGGNIDHTHNIHIINNLYSKHKIKLNIFTRKICNTNIANIDTNKFDIHFIEDIETINMIKILKQSSYVLINYNNNDDHNTGISCSGSLQLALSTLCKPIIINTANQYLKIENALEFDIDSVEPIDIDEDVEFQSIEQERNKYVDKFDNYIIKQKQVALIVEPRKLEKLDKIISNVHNKLNNNSRYKWCILFYCGKGLKTYYLSLFHNIDITIIELDTNNFTFMEYNDFLKSLSLWKTINSEYTLVFQADCYIFNNPPYTIDNFIDKNCSYIGGNMSYQWKELEYHNINSQYRNYNGGLSLRKTKDMINIIQSFNPEQSIEKIDKFETYGEDVYFTIGAYKLNLKIGNTKDDQYFSCHSIITDKCFGIHNSNTFLDKKKLLDIYPEIYNQSYIINDNLKKELVSKNMYINNDSWSVIEDNNIIFMETNEIDKEFLSNKKSPFILVTANNLDYPSCHNNDIEILNNPYLIKWFGTFPAITHSKLSPLPLGPKANWKKTEFLSEYMNTNMYDIASKDINPLVHNRKSLLYCNFSNTTSNPYIKEHKNCRIKLWEILKNIEIPVTNVKSQKDYLSDLSNFVYCLCPPGNGCDSHRVWEALMMNCIPIVIKYEPISELYKNLPVLILDKWEDLTVELLNSKKEYFSNFVFNRELIYKKYYIDKIKKESEPINKLQQLQNKIKITGGDFKEELIEQIIATKYINENDKVLEIGGNIGRNSMIIASLLNNHENLTVMETDPKSFKILKYNKEINNMNFKIINAGLSNKKLVQNSWDTYYDDTNKNNDNFFHVNNITYNDLLKITETDYNVLVLDCEGAFYYILKEFPEIITNIDKILIENDYKTIEEKKYVDNILFNNNFVSVFKDYHPDKWGPFYDNFYEVYLKITNPTKPNKLAYYTTNIAFWDNELCERETTIAMYDYAYYNKTILGNKSYIFYDKNRHNNKKEIIEKFKKDFVVHETDDFKEVDEYLVKYNISHIYIIKGGEIDSRLSKVAKNCIHCVYNCTEPHGEVYSSIAPWVKGNNNKYPVVPHMVNLPKNNNNMREKLNIPKNAIVFGGYGGKENFNIKFVQNVVSNIAQNNNNIYFLFANFYKFCQDLPNIIFLPMITNLQEKVEFINTCDAMLWARLDGEVMSMSMGEFSTLNKPIICKDIGRDRGHVHLLKDKAIWYNNEKDLTDILLNFNPEIESKKDWNAYKDYTPEKVMKIFDDVFLKNNKLQQLQNKIKIIDCFTFYNEIDLLTYRLNILNDVVDYFVLVEATHTYVGKEKPLFYQDNKHLFEKFNHKIIHIIVDDFTHKFPNINIEKDEQWINERYQRDCISRGIDKLSLQNNDVITITDLDEIPNPTLLKKIKNNEILVDQNILELDLYYYNLETMLGFQWTLSKIISYKNYKELGLSCQQIRENISFKIIKNSGWHLTYFGDEKFIKNKIQNFGHQEYNNNNYTDEKHIEQQIINGKDLFGRQNINIINIDIKDNDNLPPAYDIYLKDFYKTQLTQTKTNKNIAFFIRHFTERGTEVAVYDYAHYNEKILGNKSYIIHFSDDAQKKYGFPDIKVSFLKFNSRFEMIEINDITDMKLVIEKYKLDFFYTLTDGGQDIYKFDNKYIWDKCKTIKHCVFDTTCNEGDYYLSISNHLNKKYETNIPLIPHIVDLPNTDKHLRDELNIPHDAIVIGRFGGFYQFDLEIAHKAILEFLNSNFNSNIYFLFMNTNKFFEHPKIIYLEKNIDLLYKTKFINTCDAMIHARSDGETFGLSIAEFSIKNKPIITCPCGDLEHILLLGDKALTYNDKDSLIHIFYNIKHLINKYDDWNCYKEFTPEKVMNLFNNIVFDI